MDEFVFFWMVMNPMAKRIKSHLKFHTNPRIKEPVEKKSQDGNLQQIGLISETYATWCDVDIFWHILTKPANLFELLPSFVRYLPHQKRDLTWLSIICPNKLIHFDLKSNKCLRFLPVNHQLFCEAGGDSVFAFFKIDADRELRQIPDEIQIRVSRIGEINSSLPALCKQIMPGLRDEIKKNSKRILNGEYLNTKRHNLLWVANSRTLPLRHHRYFKQYLIGYLCHLSI